MTLPALDLFMSVTLPKALARNFRDGLRIRTAMIDLIYHSPLPTCTLAAGLTMPTLTRNTPKLLTTVKGKQHATNADHYESLQAAPANSRAQLPTFRTPGRAGEREDVDINADPLSSGDENAPPVQPPSNGKTFIQARRIDASIASPKLPAFKQAHATASPSSVGSKRSSEDGQQSDDTDAMLFSSQGSGAKRRKTSQQPNIHAPAGYGKERRRREERMKSASEFKNRSNKAVLPAEKPKMQGFVKPKVKDVFVFGDEDERAKFRAARSGRDCTGENGMESSPPSPLSSSTSSPHDVETHACELSKGDTDALKVECTMCGQLVDRFLKEDFENEFTPGQQLSYKWQQRFCIYHKQQEGRTLWVERGYPEIDWSGLEYRMRRHKPRLVAVIDGKCPSFYRDRLSERLKERLNTTMEVLSAEKVKREAVVGYYGPRGERIMQVIPFKDFQTEPLTFGRTDHIVIHLSDYLRTRASKDRLVAAAGVSGGVSGFVQAVLVPELAEMLVMEDMMISAVEARAIVTDSAELGDLVNPEAEEKVPVVDVDE